MKLREATIRGYRSVRQPLRLILSDRTTILLGANDHGKTNVLEALRHLNRDDGFTPDDLNWDCESQPTECPYVAYTLDLDDAERRELAEAITAAQRRSASRAFATALDEAATAEETASSEAMEKLAAAESELAAARAVYDALGTPLDPPSADHVRAQTAILTATEDVKNLKAAASEASSNAKRRRQLANLALADESEVLAELRGEKASGAADRALEAASQEANRRSAAAKTAHAKVTAADTAHAEAVAAGQTQEELTRLASEVDNAKTAAVDADRLEAEATSRAASLKPVAEAAALLRQKKLAFPKEQSPPRPEPFKEERAPRAVVLERKGLEGERSTQAIPHVPADILEAFLDAHLPKVELIGPEQKVSDVATKEALNAPDNDFMRGIFWYAGLPPGTWDGIFNQTPATTKSIDEASDRLNTTLRESWSQGEELKFRLRHRSGEIDLEIHDPAVEARYVPASRKSSGFTHFFAIKTILHAREQASGASKFIWLFDEPGLYLHPQGQHDLLQVMETLSRKNQVVYTTHSIFLLNKNHPTRHRLLKKDEEGTTIDSKPYSGRWKAAIDSLGLALPGTVLFAQKVLLVEGDSDPIYINATLQRLIELELIDIDLNSLSIIATGNLRDADALIRMLTEAALKPEIAILVDGDKGGDDRLAGLKKLIVMHEIETRKLENGTSVEDHVLSPDTLLPKALGEYLGHLEACALTLDKAKAEVDKAWAERDKGDGRAKWLMDRGKAIGGLDDKPSKVGIARQYLLSLGSVEAKDFDEAALERPVALARTIKELLDLPSETVQEGSVLA